VRYFGDRDVEIAAVINKDKIVEEIQRLCANDPDFKRSIELTTKTPLAVATRMRVWGEHLSQIVGRRFDGSIYRLV
jgi:hypothetical protein